MGELEVEHESEVCVCVSEREGGREGESWPNQLGYAIYFLHY